MSQRKHQQHPNFQAGISRYWAEERRGALSGPPHQDHSRSLQRSEFHSRRELLPTKPTPPARSASSRLSVLRATRADDAARYGGKEKRAWLAAPGFVMYHRRIPFEIFDDLPESKVDPEVGEERHSNFEPDSGISVDDDYGFVKDEDEQDDSNYDKDPQSYHLRNFHPPPPQNPQTILRQECSDGTVFGLLNTPTCKPTYFSTPYISSSSTSSLRTPYRPTYSSNGIPHQSLEEDFRRPRFSTLDYRPRTYTDFSHACCYRDRGCCYRSPPWRYDLMPQDRSLSPTRTDTSITQCLNPNIRVSRQVLSDNFQDFCQTMLASERQLVDQKPKIINSSQSSRLISIKPIKQEPPSNRFNESPGKDLSRSRSNPILSSPSIVKEVLKKIPSQTNGSSPIGSPQKTFKKEKSLDTKEKDKVFEEALEVIKELDMSIAEEDVFVDGPPPPVFPRLPSFNGSTSPTKINGVKNGKRDEVEVENDNLIEEVCLPGSNKKCCQTLQSPAKETTSEREANNHKGVEARVIVENRNGVHHGVNGSSGNDSANDGRSGSPPSLIKDTRDVGDSCIIPDESQLGRSDTADSGVASRPGSGVGSHFVVVAIDFGTTYSGYAFSFTRDPDNIHMMRKWEGGDPGIMNQKTPTTLLLNADGQFHSFGFSARDMYHDLDQDEAKRWLYFEKFKMTLHSNENLSRDTEICAANGKTMPALTVFAHALRYFRDQALKELSEQSATTILPDDVRWVVTVPAIWRQPAKQFMRAAAYKAGIASSDSPEQLIIALEPEAASIYCRKLRMHQLVPETPLPNRIYLFRDVQAELNLDPAIDESKKESLYLPPPQCDVIEDYLYGGTKYMVVDCGGGTVDITVHELHDQHGTLKELHKAIGGPFGSVGVDIEFERLLCEIFGADFIEQFKVKRPAGWVDLMIAFEARKRNASPFKETPLNISLPFSLIDYYRKCKGGSVESAIKKYGNKDIKWSSQGMLRLEPSAMYELFKPTITNIKHHICNILDNPKIGTVHYLFLVGGFAESQILQKEVRDAFSRLVKVIIPQGVSLAILRGAVLFGLDPMIVNVRRSRMTYGVGVLNRFIHGVHPSSKLVVKDNVEWCADILDKFVLADQSVGLGDVVVRSYTPAKVGQMCSIIHIYCSERDDIHFITDPGVFKCGTLILDLTDTRYLPNIPTRREIQTRMVFGETEIKVSALDVASGRCVKADIDFLNQ